MKLEDKVFFMYANEIKQGEIIEITQTRYGYYYALEFYDNKSDLCKIKLDGKDIFTTLYKLLENLEDEFYLRIGELSKDE